MSLPLILIIIALATGVGFLIFIIVRSFVVPHRIEALEGLIKKGKLQTAIKSAKHIITKDPRSAEAHYWLGMAYLADKRDELAILEFKTVNQLGISGKKIPEQEFRLNLAQLFLRMKQEEEALKEYLMLIKLFPTRGDYYYQAGKLFSERNNTEMAEKYLSKAAELCPKDGKILYELGLMMYRSKKTGEAKAAFQAALKLPGTNSAQIYFYQGKILKDAKEYSGALESFEKAARDAQIRIRALVERGGCYMALKAMDKAIPDLERAVKSITDEASQDSLYARYFLAMCYEQERNLEKAMAQWELIYNQKKNFRDVGEKLASYQDVRTDDTLKDYLTSGSPSFIELCETLVTSALDLHITDTQQLDDGCQIKAIDGESSKWRNTRKMPRLFRFYRLPDPIEEEKVRSIIEDARQENIPKTALFSSSGFSQKAADFATLRSVELIGKEKLEALLKKASQAESS